MIKKELNKIANKINKISSIDKLYSYAEEIEKALTPKPGQSGAAKLGVIRNFIHKLILKKEQELGRNISRKNYPSFNKILCRKIYHEESTTEICKKFPLINRNIGRIPKVFLENTDKKQRKMISEKIYNLFSFYAMKLNVIYEDINFDELEKIKTNFENDLENIINKKVKLSYIGCGWNSNAYKIKIENKQFCFKAFFPPNIEENIRHGMLVEPQMSFYATKNGSKKQFVKFFFGKVGSAFHYDAFTVTEFLERKKNFIPNERFKADWLIITDDKPVNIINGTIVDIGSLKIKISACKDKEIRAIMRVVCRNINLVQSNSNGIYNCWKIKNKNFKTIKNYIKRVKQEKYKQAINEIAQNFEIFPVDLKEILLNINDYDESYSYHKENQFSSKDLFNLNSDNIEKKLKQYSIKIPNRYEPSNIINTPGLIFLDFSKKKFCAIEFNNNHETLNIKLYKQEEDNKPLTLIFTANNKDEILDAANSFDINKFLIEPETFGLNDG